MLPLPLTKDQIVLSKTDFSFFREKIYRAAGISLSEAKIDLVQARLRGRLGHHGFKSFGAYASYLASLNENDVEWQFFINALTTNKTEWFREVEHFDYIRDHFLPQFLESGKKHLRVWCCAASTGEEPYSLSLLIREALKGSKLTYEILATDIDTNVLQVARNGVYRALQVKQIPPPYLKSGFIHGTEEISDWMKVRHEIKEPITFKQLNLVGLPYAHQLKFDLILCRNVFIYFDGPTVARVTQEMFRHAEAHSLLIIAHSESLQNIETPWAYRAPSLYTKGSFY